MKTISISLPDQTVDRLDSTADQVRRSRSNMIRSVLEEWLDRFTTGSAGDINAGSVAATEAARTHLAEHRRLGGIPGETSSE
jgi:metal-responsive CopG/Arc/MetJ family transcriptional regulator